MAQHDRRRLRWLITFYAVLALAWIALARWVVPPFLVMERPGAAWSAIIGYVRSPHALFLTDDTLSRWRGFSGAVLIAMALHLTIVVFLRRYDLAMAAAELPGDDSDGRLVNRWLVIVSFPFLAVTVLTGPVQDYYFYLQMWYEVRQGHDPWFLVYGWDGHTPLNAYGPLFNLFAGLDWVNSLAPKLLFALAYVLFAITRIKNFHARHRPSAAGLMALMALFWNPFPWVEIAIRGHFDILIAFSCLGAIRAVAGGRDVVAGGCLAGGVLLKYFPITLLPFLALDRGRLRPRFLIAAVAAIALGLSLSLRVWGLSTFAPLTYAATRSSATLSIFRFLRGRYSPHRWFSVSMNFDYLAPYVLFLALLWLWAWCRARRLDIETAAVAAAVTTVLFYQTGYPQYQMVPFVLATSWAVGRWQTLRSQSLRLIAFACYVGWLAAFDLYYAFVSEQGSAYYWHIGREVVGLPSFLFGSAFLAALIWPERQPGQEVG
jgi:hypothetical protein